jgi:hypothetical protein
MFYVKLNKDNEPDRYPYTLTDLVVENRHISFPSNVDESVAEAFKVYPVIQTEAPEVKHTQNVLRSVAKNKEGKWVETWKIEDATEKEIKERTEQKQHDIRYTRDKLLKESDWTQFRDVPVDQDAWAIYRKALRDIPQQEGFPWDVTWPEKP